MRETKPPTAVCINCKRTVMFFAVTDVTRFGPMCPDCYKAWWQGYGVLGDEHEEYSRLRWRYRGDSA